MGTQTSDPRLRRGPFWAWLLVCLGLTGVMAYLRFVVYPEAIIPLAYILILLVCLWNRDRRLLWGMVGAFVAMGYYKAFFTQPEALEPRLRAVFFTMQVINIVVAAGVIHFVIGLMGRLERSIDSLEQANSELEATNEELAAREEEISRQNEELAAQGEELEQQMEELATQAEELQTVNGQLALREGELEELLDTSFAGASEADMLAHIGTAIQRLLGPRASGAAMIAFEDEQPTSRPVFGLAQGEPELGVERSTLGGLVWERHEAALLADVDQRPDLELPRLESGAPVRSVIAAPLRGGGHERGALEIYSATTGDWKREDLRLVQWIAEQCGRLWVSARLRARLEQERELTLERERAARIESERANRAKDEFVATLSHELRTPLNAILGWVSIVQRPDCDGEELRRGLEVIERNGRHQAQLIGDLLDISRIHAGKVDLEVAPVDLAALIEGALESVRLTAEAKGLELGHHIPPLDGVVLGDGGRLQQVVWNFLTNAIKFTPRGGKVSVRVRQVHGSCEVEVSDTGQGIAPQALPLLFDRYFQVDGSATRRHGGLGLGLAISRKLAELHGGRIEARSDGVGKGASFLMRLPLRRGRSADAQIDGARLPSSELSALEEWLASGSDSSAGKSEDAQASRAEVLAGLRLLIVDDDRDARELLQRILSDSGASLSTAASGSEALGLIESDHPDVLISDIAMPEMDGFALIHHIRTQLSLGEIELPAIALTAFAGKDDRTRALLAGFQSHLPKPVDPRELVATITRLADRRRRL